MHRLKRSLSWLILVALLLQIISPLAPAAAYAAATNAPRSFRAENLRIAQAAAEHPIQALLIFNRSNTTAEAFRDLLEDHGVAVTLRPLADDTFVPPAADIYVPTVSRGGASTSQAENPVHRTQDGELTQFDVIILGHDLEEGGTLEIPPALQQEILASGRPVVALGRGGASFLRTAGVLPTEELGSRPDATAVNLCDRGAGLPLFQGETDLPLDQPAYALYAQGQPTIFSDLEERVPLVRRLACVETSAREVAILLTQDRFALWGFAGGPEQMTETGRALFVNLLWLLAGENVEIPLAAGGLRPTPGVEQDLLDALATGEAQYALAQFYALPDAEEQDELARNGIELLTYLAHNTYSAKIQPDANLDGPLVEDLLRFAGIYRPEYKLHPDLDGPLQDEYERAVVHFFPDVSLDEILIGLLQPIFGEGFSQGFVPTEWVVPNDAEKLAQLAESPLVRFIAPLATPQDFNENARPVVGTDNVQSVSIAGGNISYLGMSGQGVTLGIFERRPLPNHGDLNGRIISGANAHADVSSHATHVGGIILGNGAISQAQGLGAFQRRGHAPQARLVTQSYATDSTASGAATQAFADNFADSVLNHGVRSSNHSYLLTQGLYDAGASGVDTILRGDGVDSSNVAIPASLGVWAVGNNGSCVGCAQGNIRGFYSIFASAKNPLAVGSTDSDTGEKSNFSSKGPTYDGRIKPDVVAPGCRDSEPAPSIGIMSSDTANGNTYGAKCGTSMATPVVTGITGLMLQQYRNSFGASFVPLPSSLKAILVNTAIDQVGTSFYNDPDCNCTYNYGVGPDWATGYGLVDAPAAIAAVRARNIIEGVVSSGNTVDTYEIQVTAGRPELRFTLAWDDEAGDTSTGATVRKLVNDLDLLLIDPNGNPHFPWVLDPLPVTNNPSTNGADPIAQADINNNPAFRDVNDRDNVEQVVVDNPMPGTWTIQVTASALPNANPQPYSLAGDFRELSIIRPTPSHIADAGDPALPNVILVRLEARQPYASPTTSAFSDAAASDFQVEIGGIAADVINGLAVGDQFWLNVRPQAGQYNSGSKYALSVTWTGYGADSKNNAVLFTEREVTDRALVVDYSGSMIGYDKMQAAQNAARLFIDQSLPGDRVAVVGFSTDVITPYAITEVSSDPLTPEMNAAKNAVDSFSPDALTAIGKGLLEGYAQVTAPPTDHSVVDVIILLSDGMENVDPRYDTPAVKGLIQPTDTIVHTVGVGPANAGFFSLLQNIADDNDGVFISVTETTPGAGGASIAAADASQQSGLDAQPVELPNRLAEAYKFIAEDLLRESRLYQARGVYQLESPVLRADWSLNVPEDTARLNLALNWSSEFAYMRMVAHAPDGTIYAFNPKEAKEATCRSDKTHEVCIIDNPMPGAWRVSGFISDGVNESFEYAFWASAQTPVQFHLHIGTPPADRLPGQPIHVIGFVHQFGKPLPGPATKVTLKVFDPHGNDVLGEIELHDDGKSQDGEAGDGIFGGTFIAPAQSGPYNVRAEAKGTNAEGQLFELLANVNFQLRPRVLYVHEHDVETANQYREWIQAHGIAVDLAHKHSLPDPDDMQAAYGLIIIGPDTGEWNSELTDPIVRRELRVLGLGRGGHAFLRRFQIPEGQASEGRTIAIGDYGDDIWYVDYEFDILNVKLMDLYLENTLRIDIPANASGASAIFGLNSGNPDFANLLMFNSYWTLWGFQDGPKAMTDTGRELLINTVLRAMR